jgi:Ca-activated chloride channel family protein
MLESSFFHFAAPWGLLLGVLVALAYLLRRRPQSSALAVASSSYYSESARSWRVLLRRPYLFLMGLLCLGLVTIAAARPQRVQVLIEPKESPNLMLSVDVSRSMGTEDFAAGSSLVSRFEAVKSVLSAFVRDRKDDRIGLVVFGSSAFLQSPLTNDHELVAQFVNRLQLGMAGDGTAIGDGLGIAIKHTAEMRQGSRAVVLLTDGVNNSGQVNPLQAARLAKDLGIKVHTIGIGSTREVSVRHQGPFFGGTSRQQAEYDEATLRSVAELTGGVFFNAETLEGLKKVYQEIDQLERTSDEKPRKRIVQELFVPFLVAALLSYLALLLGSRVIFRKLP